MNRSNHTYCQSTLNAIFNGTFAGCTSTGKAPRERFAEYYAFSDEGNAGGFSNSKAQRECFAERYDFSATNTSIRDEETGYGYFGARYMDHELMTMWLSVDPMADKYPSISPFNYCVWTRPTGGDEHRWIKYNTVNNSIKLIDPDECDSIVLMPYNKRSKYDDVWIRFSDRNNTISVHTHGVYDNQNKKFKGIMISDNSPKGYHYGGVKDIVREIQNSPVYKKAQKMEKSVM